MLDRGVTRQVFEGLSPQGEAIFYILALLASITFLVGIGLRVLK